jgi:hypothetical protein
LLANIALVRVRALSKLARSQRAFRKLLVQSQAVADQHQRRTHCGTQIADGLTEEFIELRLIDTHDSPSFNSKLNVLFCNQ